MVRRWFSLLIVAACFVGTTENALAHEDLWGWLEQFSGPGPFRGPSVELLKVCNKSGPTILGISGWSAGTPNDGALCVWADQRFFHARAGGGFTAVNALLLDQGLSYSWRRLVSVGAGVGLIHFTTSVPEGDVTTNRLTLTPVRLTLNPLNFLAFTKDNTRHQNLSNVLSVPQLYYKVICVPGKLAGANFGVPGHPYTSSGECLESWGLQFNFMELLR